ncbi:hypothetical protein [Nonomuraea sp. NPDC050786]|uniref:hypothetical protein n=1 Tax=Nonomuraea sp. NPDC050786 TaxID=3154840 RepID=UPI0033EE4875
MRYRTSWSPESSPWEELAATLLEAWKQDASVEAMGSEADVDKARALWADLERCMREHDPAGAVTRLFEYYGRETSVSP